MTDHARQRRTPRRPGRMVAYASRWLEGEIEESRVTRPADTSFPPEQRIETMSFISAELDAMVMGFRRASDILRAMNPGPDEMPPCRDRSQAKRPHYLHVVK